MLSSICKLKGGYMVQPPATPFLTNKLITNNSKLTGRSQKLKFFKRGRTISSFTTNKGINQFPNPPINIGITKKKIIIKP